MKLFAPFFVALILLSCSHTQTVKREVASVPDMQESLASFNDIIYMSSNERPSYLKFVIDVQEKNWKIQFFNSEKFKLHTEFLKNYNNIETTTEEIYKSAHFNEGRKYFFGALTDSKRFIAGNSGQNFQISAVDLIPKQDLISIDRLIKKALMFDADLAYLPAGSQVDFVYRKENTESLNFEGVKVANASLKTNEVYAMGFTVGTLRIVSAKDIESGKFLPSSDDILVLDYTPLSLSPVRGVITSRPTSANSHVSLLTDMLSIPFMFSANADRNKSIQALENKKVFFKPFASSLGAKPYTLMEITEEVYNKFDSVLINRFPKIEIKADTEKISVYRDFPQLASSNSNLTTSICGAKAANSDFIREALRSEFGKEESLKKSLDGFCIPFYYFDTFMKMNKKGSLNLREYALSELSALGESPKVEDIHAATSRIQKAILDAKVSDRHLEDIRAKVESFYANNPLIKKVRFRSSSNAEDDNRFNGAGLYESDGVKMKHFKNKNLSKVEEALKKVWSSIYSVRAYTARRQFKIDESKVYMGVLVNQSFDEDARGVALCKMDDDTLVCSVEGFPGGDLKVTHPPKGKFAEVSSLRIRRYSVGGQMFQYVVSQESTETPQGVRLFTETEAEELFAIFSNLFKAWSVEKSSDPSLELDFEWKRMKNSDKSTYMLVKQMREVPVLDVAGFDKPIFMFDKNELLVSEPEMNEYGPIGHTTWAEYKINIPQMMELEDFKKNFKRSELEISDFTIDKQKVRITNVNVFKKGDWIKDDYYKGVENKDHRLFFETDHPYYSDLNISIDYKAVKKNGRILTDNIVTLDQASITRMVNKSHYPYWKPGPTTWMRDGKYVSGDIFLESQNEFIEMKRQKNFCHNGKLIFQVDLTKAGTSHYPEDGAYPVDKIKIFKDGLPTKIKSDFEVTGGFSAFGYGDSHAEDSEDIVSYQYSAYITEKEQAALGLKKARFFVVSRYGNYENPRVVYTTFGVDMQKLKQKKIDTYCPGENENGESLDDPSSNGAG